MSHDPKPLSEPPGQPDPLTAALAKLEPAPPALNRDRLLFEAGAASRTTVIRLWQLTAGFLAAVGFSAGAGMYFQPPVVVERVIYIEQAAEPANEVPLPAELEPTPEPQPEPEAEPQPPPEPPRTIPAAGYSPLPYFSTGLPDWLQLRNDILTGGIGMIPDPGRPGEPPAPPGWPPK